MSQVLVTGGAGFIGSHLADALIARGHDVTVLDDLSGGFPGNVPPAAAFARGSLTDHALVDRLFAGRRIEHVYHLAAAGAIAIAYAIQLHGVVGEWNRYAAISHAAVQQIQQEAASQPDGTLIVAGVPRLSWAFAVPHSVRPPFTGTDLTKRIFVISDSSDHCCNLPLWTDYTRDALQKWHDDPTHPPVIGLYWNPMTRRMSRVSDRDDPQLRTLASLLLETKSREALDSVIRGMLNGYVALR